MKELQLVTDKFACLIILDNDERFIFSSAPMLAKFNGQPLRNLIRWAQTTFKEAKLINLVTQETLYEKIN